MLAIVIAMSRPSVVFNFLTCQTDLKCNGCMDGQLCLIAFHLLSLIGGKIRMKVAIGYYLQLLVCFMVFNICRLIYITVLPLCVCVCVCVCMRVSRQLLDPPLPSFITR